MRRAAAALLAVSAMLLAGCGSPTVDTGAGGTRESGGPEDPTPVTQGSVSASASGSASAAESERPRSGRPRSTGSGTRPRSAGPAPHNTMPLDVTLSRTCVVPGQEMSATAVTEPQTKLAFAASYARNDFMPDFSYTPAESNPTGTFTWTWVVKPTVPPGDALLTVVAGKDQRGASFDAPFRVARVC